MCTYHTVILVNSKQCIINQSSSLFTELVWENNTFAFLWFVNTKNSHGHSALTRVSRHILIEKCLIIHIVPLICMIGICTLSNKCFWILNIWICMLLRITRKKGHDNLIPQSHAIHSQGWGYLNNFPHSVNFSILSISKHQLPVGHHIHIRPVSPHQSCGGTC